jgi:hypothetical protein
MDDPETSLNLLVIKALKDCHDLGLLDLVYKLIIRETPTK